MTRLGVFVTYPNGTAEPALNFARTCDLFARFTALHPLLATISPRAVRSGRRFMEAQPIFPDVTPEQWNAAYADHRAAGDRHGHVSGLGVQVPYWNRREHGAGLQMITVTYDVTLPTRNNEVALAELTPELAGPDMVLALMKAAIESFGARRAEAAWLNNDRGGLTFLYHRLWLREGEAFPQGQTPPVPGQPIRPGPMDRYPAGHPEPDAAEQWLGGTLHLWPARDPTLLMQGGAGRAVL